MSRFDRFHAKMPDSTPIATCQHQSFAPALGTIRRFNSHTADFGLQLPGGTSPTVTLQDMQRALPGLDEARFTRLVRRWPPADEGNLTGGEQLVLAFAEWLADLNQFTDTDCFEIMTWTDLGKQRPGRKPFMVVIADGRYVGCPGKENWLDIQTRVAMEMIPETAVTLACCDLMALAQRLVRRMHR
jgi:hypothetical protein